MDGINSTQSAAYLYMRRAARGQLAALVSSASAVLAASAAQLPMDIARIETMPVQGASLLNIAA